MTQRSTYWRKTPGRLRTLIASLQQDVAGCHCRARLPRLTAMLADARAALAARTPA